MKTITHTPESKTFERIVRALDGRLFRVRFVVVERNGVLRGKVISCEEICGFDTDRMPTPRRQILPFLKGVRQGREGFYLPVWQVHQTVKDKGLRIKDFFPSPYFNKFEFLTVIKIRAPSKDADVRG